MSILAPYFGTLKEKTVAVIGMGVSNTPLIALLRAHHISVTVRDRAQPAAVAERAAALEGMGVQLILGEGYLENLTEDVIFRTPGLSPNAPQLVEASGRGSHITSEMELFFAHCPCHTIGITGSDGKTTTTTIVAEFLRAAGHRTFVGGNIGTPLLPQIDEMEGEDWAVLELSSFQLMDMPHSPEVAVFTNLTPNHLDYHHTMDEYQTAKTNIFTHQRGENRAIFNADSPFTLVASHRAVGEVTLFSRRAPLERGIFLQDNAIWVADEGGSRGVLPLDEILLPGSHNVENYMAAIAAVQGLVPDHCIRGVASTFGGVAHRNQLVREVGGVRYYNDSIGSSPNRTIACLQSFAQPVILIAGGYDKKTPFDEVAAEMVQKVKLLCLTGDTAEKIKVAVESAPDYWENHPEILLVPDFDGAVLAACQRAREGDTVVLSPACASFDQFKNFVERGNRFCQLIQNLT